MRKEIENINSAVTVLPPELQGPYLRLRTAILSAPDSHKRTAEIKERRWHLMRCVEQCFGIAKLGDIGGPSDIHPIWRRLERADFSLNGLSDDGRVQMAINAMIGLWPLRDATGWRHLDYGGGDTQWAVELADSYLMKGEMP